MIGISTHTGSGDLGIYTRTAGQGVLKLLKHENSRTLTHHKTVPGPVEGTGSRSVFVIVGGKCLGSVKAAYGRYRDRGFRSSCQDYIGLAQTDQIEGVSHRMRR